MHAHFLYAAEHAPNAFSMLDSTGANTQISQRERKKHEQEHRTTAQTEEKNNNLY